MYNDNELDPYDNDENKSHDILKKKKKFDSDNE